jgi:hypothetical protein
VTKNTSEGYRKGTVANRTQVKNPRTGLWTKRDGSTGQFTAVKKDGGSFIGIERER